MKKAIFTILFFSLALSGCSLSKNNNQPSQPSSNQQNQQAGLANPASTFCVEQGGKLEMRDNDAGQYGVCVFEDGSECEEWAFFRLECKPGETKQGLQNIEQKEKSTEQGTQSTEQEDKDIFMSQTGNDSIKVFDIKSGDNITSPVTIKGEGVAFENNLIVELRNKDHEILVKEPVTIKSSEVGKSGLFEITLNFEFTNTKEGFIAVYEESAKDGSEMNLVEIPVVFD